MGVVDAVKGVVSKLMGNDHDVQPEGEPAETNNTVYTAREPKAKAKSKDEKGGMFGKFHTKPKSMRRTKLEHGYGMLTPTGNYLSPHDIRCLQISGCDLNVLVALRMGEVPEYAPNSTEIAHPMQIQEAQRKAIGELNDDLTTTACVAATV